MSSSEGPKAQKRSPLVHAEHGNALRKVCFPRSTEIDLKQTYPTPRRIDNQSAPDVTSLPLDQPKRYEHRDGVHFHQAHRPTMFPMKSRAERSTWSKPDTLVQGVTRITGKENRREWRTSKRTTKTEAKRAKAAAWLAKNR
jgi:hypothetical protein